MGPNRLVAWQRRAGMSGHVRFVAHMEKIDMADRCAVSAHSCDVVSHKVRWARWRLLLETRQSVYLKIFVFVTERWRETRSALVFEDFIRFRRCHRSDTLTQRRGARRRETLSTVTVERWRRDVPSPIVFDDTATRPAGGVCRSVGRTCDGHAKSLRVRRDGRGGARAPPSLPFRVRDESR